METVTDFIFLGSKITVDGDCNHEIRRCLLLGRKAMTNLDKCIKKQRCHSADKGPSSQSYCFSSSHVRMYVLDHKKGWAPRNWCFQTVVLEKTLESSLDCKIKSVSAKGNLFIGRTDTEAEAPILWPPDTKGWLIRKDPDAGKDWGQEEKRDREWDAWMASPTRWTWVWANYKWWWRTGKPGVLQSMGSQRVRHNWVTEQQQILSNSCKMSYFYSHFTDEETEAHWGLINNLTKDPNTIR